MTQLISENLRSILRSEDELLLYCARTTIEAKTVGQVHDLVKNSIDWTYLINNAVHHRVMPLLFRSLESTCPQFVPNEVLSGLQGYCQDIAKRNLFLTAELLKLIENLEVKGIAAIPYKGPCAAFLVYGNICLRQFNDLDILVRPEEYTETIRLLLSQGYQLTTNFAWECTLENNERGVRIDVHKAVTPQEFSIRLNFDRLWSGLETIPAVGGRIRTLSAEDFLLILCIQLAKDSWGQSPLRLSKVCDVAELLRSHNEIDWEKVLDEARQRGCLRILGIGLYSAHNWLGAAIPESISQLMAYPQLTRLKEHILQELFSYAADKHPARLSSEQFYVLIRERWRDRYYPNYYDFKSRLLPNKRDHAFIELPESIAFLYYLIRPLRLLRDWSMQGIALARKGLFTWRD